MSSQRELRIRSTRSKRGTSNTTAVTDSSIKASISTKPPPSTLENLSKPSPTTLQSTSVQLNTTTAPKSKSFHGSSLPAETSLVADNATCLESIPNARNKNSRTSVKGNAKVAIGDHTNSKSTSEPSESKSHGLLKDGRYPKPGDSVEIWWDKDNVFYAGTLRSVSKENPDIFRIDYDDGEIEYINLLDEKWKFSDTHSRRKAPKTNSRSQTPHLPSANSTSQQVTTASPVVMPSTEEIIIASGHASSRLPHQRRASHGKQKKLAPLSSEVVSGNGILSGKEEATASVPSAKDDASSRKRSSRQRALKSQMSSDNNQIEHNGSLPINTSPLSRSKGNVHKSLEGPNSSMLNVLANPASPKGAKKSATKSPAATAHVIPNVPEDVPDVSPHPVPNLKTRSSRSGSRGAKTAHEDSKSDTHAKILIETKGKKRKRVIIVDGDEKTGSGPPSTSERKKRTRATDVPNRKAQNQTLTIFNETADRTKSEAIGLPVEIPLSSLKPLCNPTSRSYQGSAHQTRSQDPTLTTSEGQIFLQLKIKEKNGSNRFNIKEAAKPDKVVDREPNNLDRASADDNDIKETNDHKRAIKDAVPKGKKGQLTSPNVQKLDLPVDVDCEGVSGNHERMNLATIGKGERSVPVSTHKHGDESFVHENFNNVGTRLLEAKNSFEKIENRLTPLENSVNDVASILTQLVADISDIRETDAKSEKQANSDVLESIEKMKASFCSDLKSLRSDLSAYEAESKQFQLSVERRLTLLQQSLTIIEKRGESDQHAQFVSNVFKMNDRDGNSTDKNGQHRDGNTG